MSFLPLPAGIPANMAGRLRDQAAQDMELLPRKPKTFFELMGSEQDQLTAADRQALLNFGSTLANGQNGFLGGLADASANFAGTQQTFADKEEAQAQALADRQNALQQQEFENSILSGRLDVDRLRALNSGRAKPRQQSPGQKGNTYITPDRRIISSTFDPNSQTFSYVDAQTGDRLGGLPEGAIPTNLSDLKMETRDIRAGTTTAAQEVSAAYDNIAELNRQYALIEQNKDNLGPGLTAVINQLSLMSGYQFGDVDVTDLASLKQIFANQAVNASQRLKGQGQITENERKLLERTLPSAYQDPEAMLKVLDIMRAAEKRKIGFFNDYINDPEAASLDFSVYMAQRMYQLERDGGGRKGETFEINGKKLDITIE